MRARQLIAIGMSLVAWAASDAGRRHPDLAVRCLIVAHLCGLAALIELTNEGKERLYA